VDILAPVAREHRARRVLRARLRLGEFTHVDPETLSFAFEVACRGTLLEGCELCITRVPLAVSCPACGWQGPGTVGERRCPSCGGEGFTVVAGRELQLEAIDIDDEPGATAATHA
jgi:hydrogenase nickel incorporation protein HypA/HybF